MIERPLWKERLVCHARGWDHLRLEDCGALWEHLTLDTLIAAGWPKIHFWRDEQQREVDFAVPRSRVAVDRQDRPRYVSSGQQLIGGTCGRPPQNVQPGTKYKFYKWKWRLTKG